MTSTFPTVLAEDPMETMARAEERKNNNNPKPEAPIGLMWLFAV